MITGCLPWPRCSNCKKTMSSQARQSCLVVAGYNVTMMWQLFMVLALVEPFDLEAGSAETQRWQKFLTNERADQTRFALTNARHYVDDFRRYFREEGIPQDLVWIALIESSFRAVATSPTGAQGMYQFKTPTARAFGLQVSSEMDQRNDPHHAARAAARYLRYLKGKFATWDLVLAAYNLGEGDLRRAMSRRGVTTWPEIKPHVRPATRDYVSKIKAAAIIGNTYMASLDGEYHNKQRYQVKKGDTLFAIARRLDVDVAGLIRENEINNHRIYPGQILVIPAR